MRGIFIACAVVAMMLLSCTAELEVPEHVSQNAGSTETAQVATVDAELAQETTQEGWGHSRKLLGRRDVRRRRRRRRRWYGSWRERTQKNQARERANKERGAKAERANKGRIAKERATKERSNKERTNKERANKERANKEKAAKERAGKAVKRERTAKEQNAKAAELAQKKRKMARERKGKEMRGKALRAKEKAAKAKIAKERHSKRKEKASKREKKAKHVAEIRAKVLKRIEQAKKKAAELTAKGKKKRAEKAAKKAKARKEKGLKLQAENDKKSAAKEKQKKAKIAEKKTKHEKVFKKGEKNLKSGEKALKKFSHKKYKMSKADVARVSKWCSTTAKVAGSLDGTLAAGSKSVRKMVAFAAKACLREKRAAAKAAELKKKMHKKGPTFKFVQNQPCKGGKGSFTQKLAKNGRVNVGIVPAGQPNVFIKLRSTKDVDAGLWTISKKQKRQIAVIAWRIGKINSATRASLNYQGAKIVYSGYNGIRSKNGAYNYGNEDIRIIGKAKVPFMMTVFGFKAGTAQVEYSWGPDKVRCLKQKARKRQEKRRKFYAKRAMKRKMDSKKYKSVLKIFNGKQKGCKVAKHWMAIAKTKYNKAKATKAQATARLHKCVVKGERTLKKGREMKAKAVKKEQQAKEGKKKAVQKEHQAKEQKKKNHERKSKALERSAKERNSKAVERNAKARERSYKYQHRYDNQCCCLTWGSCFGKPSCSVCSGGHHATWAWVCNTSRRCNRL